MHYPTLTAAHLANATVIERDPRGIKVLQLPNGHYLKVFRLRHRYGWARLHGYAQRFCKHAEQLRSINIPTVEVNTCFKVENESLLQYPLASQHMATTASGFRHTYVVEYAPLAGQTLKHMLEQTTLTAQHVKQLGAFIAKLHAAGVHFRSLHLGNIVLTPQGEMGLIDIADMHIYPWPLWFNTRLRSFRHVSRYALLNQRFGDVFWALLIESYLQHARLRVSHSHQLRAKMQYFLQHPPH